MIKMVKYGKNDQNAQIWQKMTKIVKNGKNYQNNQK